MKNETIVLDPPLKGWFLGVPEKHIRLCVTACNGLSDEDVEDMRRLYDQMKADSGTIMATLRKLHDAVDALLAHEAK